MSTVEAKPITLLPITITDTKDETEPAIYIVHLGIQHGVFASLLFFRSAMGSAEIDRNIEKGHFTGAGLYENRWTKGFTLLPVPGSGIKK